jgi:hypothetical protein
LAENRKFLETLYEVSSSYLEETTFLTDKSVSEGISADGVVASVQQDEPIETKSVATGAEDVQAENVVPDNIASKGNSPEVTDVGQIGQVDLDDWMKARLRKIVEARESQQQRQAKLKKDLPPIEDNPILNALKAGTLANKKAALDGEVSKRKELPPYPSREHFVGFWRTLQSPTGFPEEIGDDTRSDNLILRVDGTIAGGPILDQETRQKAAGGTWRVKEQADGSARLLIRLVIPPKKERILVMEGEVTRGVVRSIDTSASSLTTRVFDKKATTDSDDETLQCRGIVWIEDAVTKKNRVELGDFFIRKQMASTDPRDFVISIPGQVRNQD